MFKTARFATLAGALLLTACQQPSPETSATSEPAPAPAAPPLPAIDTVNAQQFVMDGGSLVSLDFARDGSTTVEGGVAGDAAPVYAVPVAAGQTLTVVFSSPSANLYANVSDATDHSGAALHRGEMDGATATLKADRDTTFVITPSQPRAMARRGETAPFSLTVSRN